MGIEQAFSGLIDILASNSLLLLFVVAALGYPLGHIRVGGGSLGVAGMLFAGLAVGAIDQRLRLPDFVYEIGLILFVYTVGLSSGPGFFHSLRGRGLRFNILVLAVILASAGVAVSSYFILGLSAPQVAGVFAGSLTNTPALAGVVEYLKTSGASDDVLSEPVVGYSLAYPISVVGMILAIYTAQRIWRVDYHAERTAADADDDSESEDPIANRTIRVSSEHDENRTVRELIAAENWDVIFGRLRRNGTLTLVNEATVLKPGDLVTVVGHPAELERVTAHLGEESREHLDLDRSALDYRRVFVSNPQVVGRRLRELNLPRRFGAVVTRVRRGDVEMLPHGNTVLEPGDRVRVVTARENIPVVSAFFGDSYRAVSEIDVLSFSLGIATGVLLGLVPIPLPGGVTVRLGLAGGPLIVALILGAVGRTGPIMWHLPFGANMMLRQIGLIFFLTGIGTRAGYEFYVTLVSGGGFGLLLTAVVIVAFAAVTTLWIGHRLMHIPMGTLSGILSGLQSQPATLAFALQQSGDERPNASYASVFPFAIISKIILAQLIIVLLTG